MHGNASHDTHISPPRLFVVSHEAAAVEDASRFPMRRGVFGFETDIMRGTLTVAEGGCAGSTRLIVFVSRLDRGTEAVPVRMEAEVRDGWIRQQVAGSEANQRAVLRVLAGLFEVAGLDGQRTVHISAPAA